MTMRHLLPGLVVVASLLSVSAVAQEMRPTGRTIHAAPDGTPDADGSAQKPLDLSAAFSAKSPARPGDTILMQAGTYEGPLKEIERVPFVLAVSGEQDKPILVMPAPGATVHLNGTLNIDGSYVWVVGLEIGDLTWDLREVTRKNGRSVNVGATRGVRIINCNVFGGWNGITAMRPAVDTEVYGCLVHDFGSWLGHNAPAGSSFYMQNADGRKVVSNCMAYRSGGPSASPHGQSGAVAHFEIRENLLFMAGGVAPRNPWDNLYANTSASMDQMKVIGNVFYQPEMSKISRANVRMSNLKSPTLNKSGVFQDNYVMGGPNGLRISQWESFQATGNTIWAPRLLVEISSATTGDGIKPQEKKPNLAGFNVSDNTYYGDPAARSFLHGRCERHDALPEDAVTFVEWQKLGLDKDSRMLPVRNGKPTGTKVFLFPNRYQPGRAHVGIFNWDGLAEAEVDMTGVLPRETRYAVYHALDIRQTLALAKPVLTGNYDGGTLKFPLRKDPACPDFDAFLVLPVPR
jgi:hypothetical protein